MERQCKLVEIQNKRKAINEDKKRAILALFLFNKKI